MDLFNGNVSSTWPYAKHNVAMMVLKMCPQVIWYFLQKVGPNWPLYEGGVNLVTHFFSFKIKKFFFNWRITTLQSCIGFCHTST